MASLYQPVDLAYNYIEPPECLMNKSPLIFLHGVSGSKEHWDQLPEDIAKATRRKTYVVDARNHGDSPWTDIFNFDVNADDLLKFMDTVNASSAILIGHSMGGITAYKAALKAPERIEKIVVEDMHVKTLGEDALGVVVLYLNMAHMAGQQIPPSLSEEDAKKFILDFIYKAMPQEVLDKFKLTKPNYRDHRVPLKKTANGSYAIKANLAAILNGLKDSRNLMSDITGDYKGPSSFIYGTLSPFDVASNKEHITKHFPYAEFVAIEDATHLVHNEKPKEFVEAVLDFLNKE